ncbi:hypothetical protein QW060_26660 [Myroides ceti]|uniref:Uncharacterized protein n=1 Tax=Paenimyroides ceti TaxID=395087 RepID=A0ABT8D0S0_9FLAO|nr:hypothetical protein [Paenimyroides ceti]MDN3710404.1 hypothetical protein [Paenimyroides ceti]
MIKRYNQIYTSFLNLYKTFMHLNCNAKIAPNTKINSMNPINEITNPAMANPLGALKIPTNEKINPSNHTSQPIKGIHPTKIAINDRIKPAIPIPLLFVSFWLKKTV